MREVSTRGNEDYRLAVGLHPVHGIYDSLVQSGTLEEGDNDEDVNVGIFEGVAHRYLIPARGSVAYNVNRVLVGHVWRKPAGLYIPPELLYRFIAQLGQLKAPLQKPVAHHDSGATAVGNYCHAVALGWTLHSQSLRVVEELPHGLGFQNAALLKSRPVDCVGASQRTGVGSGRLCPSLGSSALEYYYRLLEGDLSSRFKELPSVLNALYVTGDDASLRIVAEVVHEVALV